MTYPISTSAYRLKLQYGYANGYLQTIKDFNALTTVFWTANTVNAMGELTQETLGTTPTAVVVNRSIDAVTGWMSSNQAGVGGSTGLLNQSYLFDLVGNVTQRQNNTLGLTESACYDNVYRLDHTTATGVCTGATSLQMAYDAMGNIASRSDVNAGATWTYDAVHKHQVKTAGAGNSYSYDLNGNMTTRNGNAISWTSYNYPLTINATGEASTFDYGPDHQYWRQSYSGPSGSETTYYLGKLLERVIVAGVTDYRHYIMANGEPIAIYSHTSAGTNTLRYALEDHQGSFSAILTSAGANYVSESFAPFGARRNPTTWSGAPTPSDITLINAVTRIGYTGQAMLGSMGLIHMNGRVQDAITGRILSADPYVTEPENTQDFNRYGYVYNNPLSYVDPSGFRSGCSYTSSYIYTPPGDSGGDFTGPFKEPFTITCPEPQDHGLSRGGDRPLNGAAVDQASRAYWPQRIPCRPGIECMAAQNQTTEPNTCKSLAEKEEADLRAISAATGVTDTVFGAAAYLYHDMKMALTIDAHALNVVSKSFTVAAGAFSLHELIDGISNDDWGSVAKSGIDLAVSLTATFVKRAEPPALVYGAFRGAQEVTSAILAGCNF